MNDLIKTKDQDSLVAWYAVFVLLLAYVLSFVDRIILSLLVTPIKDDLGTTDAQMGLLMGFAFAIFYTLAGIPIAKYSDVKSRRSIIAIGIFLWSIMTAVCGLAKSFFQLFLAYFSHSRAIFWEISLPGPKFLCACGAASMISRHILLRIF